MIDYAKKKKSLHQAIFGVFLFVGLATIGLAYWHRFHGEPGMSSFILELNIGLLFVIVAGLWKAVIRLSTEVAALDAKSKEIG